MSDTLYEHLSQFDRKIQMRKDVIYPFLCHAVVLAVSAKRAHDYITDGGWKVSIASIKRWRREAANEIGLAQTHAGKPSKKQTESQRDKWHSEYGYPTLDDWMRGWKPGKPLPYITQGMTKNDKSGTVEKKHPMQRPANAKPIQPVKRRKNKFAKLAEENPPIEAGGESKISTEDILKSITQKQ